jgi:hypothetical protein
MSRSTLGPKVVLAAPITVMTDGEFIPYGILFCCILVLRTGYQDSAGYRLSQANGTPASLAASLSRATLERASSGDWTCSRITQLSSGI